MKNLPIRFLTKQQKEKQRHKIGVKEVSNSKLPLLFWVN